MCLKHRGMLQIHSHLVSGKLKESTDYTQVSLKQISGSVLNLRSVNRDLNVYSEIFCFDVLPKAVRGAVQIL